MNYNFCVTQSVLRGSKKEEFMCWQIFVEVVNLVPNGSSWFKRKRQIVYDDFHAVAMDLIAKKHYFK
jgi:hypothetical protein